MAHFHNFAIWIDEFGLDMGLHFANCFDSFDNGVIRCGLERHRACFSCDIEIL